MTDTTLPTLPLGGAVSAADIFASRQGADTEDVQVLASQLKTFFLGASNATLAIAAAKTLTVSNTLTFTGTDSSSVAFGAGGTVAYNSQIFDFCFSVEGPTNKAYTFAYNLDFGGTINATKTKSTSGTATATYKINSTALGGAANSVSSSGDSVTQSSNNVFVAGDTLSVTISANASCVDFLSTVKYTRTLA